MTNQEVADELQYAIDLIKQDGKDWLDERDIPILEAVISALRALDKIIETWNRNREGEGWLKT